MRATKAVISRENLLYNLKNIRDRVGSSRKICIAVKADSYGHDSVITAKTALDSGLADCLGIASVNEAVKIRESGIKAPVFLFSLSDYSEIPEIFDFNLIPFCADKKYLIRIAAEAEKRKTVKEVHLKIDTGMRRVGCLPEESLDLAGYIYSEKSLYLGGICTHFPVSDSREVQDIAFTEKQIALFSSTVDKIRNSGINPGIIHASNSGGILQYPGAWFDMVRPGIMLYGYYPDPATEKSINILPVMTFESKIIFIKKISKGEGVSYGLTWKAEEDTYIATIPAGYADGYNRLLSSRGHVLIRGKLYKTAGRVCMDQFMVDLGKSTDAELFDRVVLFGPEKGAPGADEIASICGTIPYEILCNINKRVPRI